MNKRNAVNNPKNPKKGSQFVVNKHPENQTSFGCKTKCKIKCKTRPQDM